MKPIKLTLEGIRSFSSKTTIDFSEVVKDGLFGIFGNTGSGKSTILDGIIFALYGRLPGLEMSEIVNAQLAKASVGLEFEVKFKTERKRYFVERVVSLKKDGGYKDAKATLVDMDKNEMIASSTYAVNAEIENIIGLGVNEFTKCIILPQGEFAKFVSSAKSERVKIIEKLFDLGRFGERFNIKLKGKLSALNAEKDKLSAVFAPYKDATSEMLESLFAEIKTCEKRITEKREIISKIEEKIKEFEKFYDKHKRLDDLKTKLNDMEEKAKEAKEAERNLSLYPRAEKIVAKEKERNVLKDKTQSALKVYTDCKNEYDDVVLKREIVKKREEEIDGLKDEKIQLEKKISEMDAIKDEVELLRKKSIDRDDRKKNLAILDERICKTEKEIEGYEGSISQLNENIRSYEDLCDLDMALKGFKDGVLKGEYEEEIGYLNERISSLSEYEESLLKRDVSRDYSERLKLFSDKISELSLDNDVAFDEIENLKKYNELKDETVKRLNKAVEEKNDKVSELSLLKEKRASLFAEWKSLCESVSSVERKILNYSDNIEDFFKNYAYHNNRLARVSEIISEYEEQAKSIERIFSEKNETRAVLLKQYQILSVDLTEKEKELSELFDDEIGLVEVAENIVASVGDYENTKRFIDKYSAEKLNILFEIEEITEFLSKCDFKISDGEDFKTEKKKLSDELSVLIENLGKIKNRASDIEEKIKRRKEIEEKIALVDKEIVKFSRLMEVVKDRKFAEYVAAEYLSDVALDARKILLELSGGKYDVVYLDGLDGKDGFFIVDNLCGGVKRSIATLSGGETFLVSLSLALSLSSQVYSKSERPMEFFFLDEGFGTLDDGLVDVVLDSLSKLKNDRFTIGLISHLNELKSRIDCKIIVDGATEIKGSSVKIVC